MNNKIIKHNKLYNLIKKVFYFQITHYKKLIWIMESFVYDIDSIRGLNLSLKVPLPLF